MPMPYTLSKGRILTVLEDMLNPVTDEETERLFRGLADLRDPDTLLTYVGLVDSTNLEDPSVAAPLDDRLNEYWFGFEPDGSGGWDPQPGYGPGHQTTGYWLDYCGDVEGILRETLARTIELAFGIPAGGDRSDATRADRPWEVEIFWKCPNPWFEGWVTWRRSRRHPEEGQVTTIIATPADALNSIRRVPADPGRGAPPLVTPTGVPDVGQGMWLVTQSTHVQPADPGAGGRSESVRDEGDVTVLELTTEAGGPAPGLRYEPPPDADS